MTSSHDYPQDRDGDVISQASKWAAYNQSGEGSQAAKEAFAVWYGESEKHREAYRAVKETWRDIGYAAVQDPDLDEEASRLAGAGPEKRRFSRRWAAAAAAAVVVCVAVVGRFQEPAEPVRYATAAGELKTVELEDGSLATLSGETVVLARITPRRREIELRAGQAFFDVERHEDRVFSVTAGGNEIRVLGTAFDVMKRADSVRVAVTEGTVEVVDVQTGDDAAVSSLILKEGELATASLLGDLGSKETFDAARALSWREGRLEYRNTPLTDVVEEVNRYRTDKISLADPALGAILITISLPIDRTDALLTGLEASEPVLVTRAPSAVRIAPRQAE